MRPVLAWTAYFAGDLVWRVCDQWLDLFNDHGLGWQLFRLNQGLMNLSDRIQGDGPGPWSEAH